MLMLPEGLPCYVGLVHPAVHLSPTPPKAPKGRSGQWVFPGAQDEGVPLAAVPDTWVGAYCAEGGCQEEGGS